MATALRTVLGRPARWLACAGLGGPVMAAGASAALCQLLVAQVVWWVVLVGFLVTYASYLIDSATEAPHQDGASERTRHLAPRRRRVAVLGMMAFAAAGAVAARQAGAWAAAGLFVFPAAVAVYCLPWRLRSPRCVKDIPYVKSFYTAFFWALMGAWVACVVRPQQPLPGAILAFVLIFWRAWLSTVFSDLKDIERDRRQGVRTLAGRLGPERLLRLLARSDLAFLAALLGVVAVSGGSHGVPTAALGLAATCVYFQALLRAAARPGADLEWLSAVVADAEWAAWPLYVGAAGWLLS